MAGNRISVPVSETKRLQREVFFSLSLIKLLLVSSSSRKLLCWKQSHLKCCNLRAVCTFLSCYMISLRSGCFCKIRYISDVVAVLSHLTPCYLFFSSFKEKIKVLSAFFFQLCSSEKQFHWRSRFTCLANFDSLRLVLISAVFIINCMSHL